MRATSASEPLLTHRKPIRRRQNRRRAILPGLAWKVSYLLSMWRPVWRRRDSHLGFRTERENLAGDAKGKDTMGWRCGGDSTDGRGWDRLQRTNDEAEERRVGREGRPGRLRSCE